MNNQANMNITANGWKTVGEVQEEFHLKFPFLVIDFYHYNGNEQPVLLDTEFKLNTFKSPDSNFTKVIVKPSHTIEDIRLRFANTFNINVLILTQSGKRWIEPSKTDYWSIEYQNDHAERLNSKMSMFD